MKLYTNRQKAAAKYHNARNKKRLAELSKQFDALAETDAYFMEVIGAAITTLEEAIASLDEVAAS